MGSRMETTHTNTPRPSLGVGQDSHIYFVCLQEVCLLPIYMYRLITFCLGQIVATSSSFNSSSCSRCTSLSSTKLCSNFLSLPLNLLPGSASFVTTVKTVVKFVIFRKITSAFAVRTCPFTTHTGQLPLTQPQDCAANLWWIVLRFSNQSHTCNVQPSYYFVSGSLPCGFPFYSQVFYVNFPTKWVYASKGCVLMKSSCYA